MCPLIMPANWTIHRMKRFMKDMKEASSLMHYFITDCQHFNSCCTYWSITRQRWRERIILSSTDLFQLTTTKTQQIILVILFFIMVIPNIKATRAEKPWLPLPNVHQKFQNAVQICTMEPISHNWDVWDP
jgi:hypothetical protein